MLLFSRYTYWTGAMVALAVALAVAGRAGALDPVQGVFLRAASPIESGLDAAFGPVARFFDDVGDLARLRAENRRLLGENETLRNENAALRADTRQLGELEEALGIVAADPSAERLPAGVLSRIRGPLTRELRIDKGSGDGVREGNPVLSVRGTLIGTVTRALPGASFVRLVADSRSSVAAQVLGASADGVVRGDGEGLSFDLAEGDVNAGDAIVTSGLGGAYPPDIPIGEVVEVRGDAQDPFPTVRLETAVRIATTRTVLVMISFAPDRFGLGE